MEWTKHYQSKIFKYFRCQRGWNVNNEIQARSALTEFNFNWHYTRKKRIIKTFTSSLIILSVSSCNDNWNWIPSAQTLLGLVVDDPSHLLFNQKYLNVSGAKGDGMSTTNPSKVCADRIQFQLTLHEEEEEDNQGTSESFDSTIVSGHQRDDHTMV